MKQGKISENVLKRSVLKYINQESKEVARGAGIGNDCALFAFHRVVDNDSDKQGSCGAAMATCSISAAGREKIRHAIYAAVNNLAASGQIPNYILLGITLPERAREIKLQEMMDEATQICKIMNAQIIGGHTEVSANVTEIIVTVTALGSAMEPCLGETEPEQKENVSQEQPLVDLTDYDIVISGYIGSEAAGLIAGRKEEQLLERFPKWLVEEVKDYAQQLSVLPQARMALVNGAALMHDVGEGGVFAALWEMAQRAGKGLTIDIKKIPMKQSVVEICNYYDLNPYEIWSQGCLLMAAADGEALVLALEEAGIEAAVIGKLTDSNDRIIENGEEIRYMDLPKPDQIRKIL